MKYGGNPGGTCVGSIQEIEPIGSIFFISYPNYQWIGFVGKIETGKPHI